MNSRHGIQKTATPRRRQAPRVDPVPLDALGKRSQFRRHQVKQTALLYRLLGISEIWFSNHWPRISGASAGSGTEASQAGNGAHETRGRSEASASKVWPV